MAESKEARLVTAIDNATQAAQKSIDAYGELAKTAAAQLRGDSPADTDKWLRLAAETWAQAARDTAQAWTAYNAVLRAFAESGEGATAPEEDATEHSPSKGNGTDP